MVLDIALVALVVYVLISIFRGTRAARIGIGLAFFAVLGVIGRLLDLETFSWLMSHAATALLVAIPVVFQPELRRFFEKVGRSGRSWRKSTSEKQIEWLLDQILPPLQALSQSQTGALMVVRRHTGLADLMESGTQIEALISKELIAALFAKSSPLHDGAVVVSPTHVLAAGVLLPLSDQEIASKYGTRHRAALGVTESSDAVAIVVSEERGEISVAVDGALHPVPLREAREILKDALLSESE